jgi:hypothetical protein
MAVLFHLTLAVPAVLTEVVLACGLVAIVMPVTWLILLITAEMPRPLHEALSAVARYVARVNGYLYLLTSVYPAGLLGDRDQGSSQPVARSSASNSGSSCFPGRPRHS